MKKAGIIIGIGILVAAGFTLFTFIVMWLWNWLMPAIFHLGVITFWQSAGLLVLSKILFSGTGHAHKAHHDYRRKVWFEKFREKSSGKYFEGRCCADRNDAGETTL
jgi:hypothetical protein